ncbi:glycosyltransferase family 39 protein [Thioclava sp. SK-1]|uniref:glycosyltransferase family 39 protein n=1 Tax=Thioclava sp. SK-1 TaxID=1889770 RepID=UPI00159F1F3C|nr:glycosyltransferase family 39 protein [Thioclava sp. SK-1]
MAGPGLELDEAEMVLNAQHLAWGYGAQFPLYNWLQYGVFYIFGVCVGSIAGLKFALLFAGFAFGIAGLRRLTGSTNAAICGGVAPVFLPDVLWEAQRSLTHSVAVIAAVMIVIWALAGVLRRGAWRDYLWLGLALGAAGLSKANIFLLLLGLVGALMVARPSAAGFIPLRRLRCAAAIGVAAICVAPSYLWIMAHQDRALASGSKFYRGGTEGPFAPILALGEGVIGALLLLAIVVAILNWLPKPKPPAPRSAAIDWTARFLGLAGVVGLALLLFGAVVAGASRISPRWLLPLSVPIAMGAGVWLYAGAACVMVKRIGGAAAVVALTVTVGLYVTLVYLPARQNNDAPGFAQQVAAQAAGAALSGDPWLVGQVLLHRSDQQHTTECGRDILVLDRAPQAPYAADLISRCGAVMTTQKVLRLRNLRGKEARTVWASQITYPAS